MLKRDSMHEIGPQVGAIRRLLGRWIPRAWLAVDSSSGAGLRARRPTRARTELDPKVPATSWVAWEISRSRTPG
jgi:hypothetical protein